MTESLSSKENIQIPRKLNPQDQLLFEHWRRIFTGSTLYSTVDNPGRVNEVPTPDNATIPTGNTLTAGPRSKDELADEATTANENARHKDCTKLVNRLFEHSPIVIFLNSQLLKIGCPPKIYCTPCTEDKFGGFNPDYGIAICQNKVDTKRRVESTLVHEMMHAYDHCRFKFNIDNLKQVACSEVSTHWKRMRVDHRFALLRYRENVDFWTSFNII
jgi:Peptidase M76 family